MGSHSVTGFIYPLHRLFKKQLQSRAQDTDNGCSPKKSSPTDAFLYLKYSKEALKLPFLKKFCCTRLAELSIKYFRMQIFECHLVTHSRVSFMENRNRSILIYVPFGIKNNMHCLRFANAIFKTGPDLLEGCIMVNFVIFH